jgi:hypothetical protein
MIYFFNYGRHRLKDKLLSCICETGFVSHGLVCARVPKCLFSRLYIGFQIYFSIGHISLANVGHLGHETREY